MKTVHQQRIADFVPNNSWFDRQYRAFCDSRYPTLKAALNLWAQFGGKTIVETGSVRLENDFGAGNSTVLFAEVAEFFDAFLWSIDINPKHVELSQRLTAAQDRFRRCVCCDSVMFLTKQLAVDPDFHGHIDLLYLDSLDYPLWELLSRYECPDVSELRRASAQSSEEDFARQHWDLLGPTQLHCLAELNAALPLLHSRSIVLMDDNDFPGGGKPRLAKQRLLELDWCCVLDSQQTLWLPSQASGRFKSRLQPDEGPDEGPLIGSRRA